MTATLTGTASGAAAGRPRPARPPVRRLAWVTWRQHRTVLLGLSGAVAASALVLFLYGRAMHADFTSLGMADCLPGHRGRNCSVKVEQFRHDENRVSQLMAAFLPLPLLFGLFLGAPLLAREYESGTYRFAFTQGAGRTRWLVTKIVLLTAFTVAASTAFTLVVMWWYAPLVPLDGRIGGTGIPEIYGSVVVGRSVLALAVGIFAGALLRRVVPAIGATLVVWIAVVVPSITALRPRLLAPKTLVGGGDDPSGWIISDVWRTPGGKTMTFEQVNDAEMRAAEAGHKLDRFSYMAHQGYTHAVRYQPAGRFWPLQLLETGMLAVLSVLLLAAAVRLVRRRAA
ncbi:MAG: ABC transporter permease subunit [Streptomyces sp.]|nr:ABC transporter permease subunit [Streptomyces sp.]